MEENKVDVNTEQSKQDTALEDCDNSAVNKANPNLRNAKGAERRWVKYVVTSAVLAVAVLLVAWSLGVFAENDPKELLRFLCDAFFVPGVLAVCFGLLVVASNGGTFDMLSYGVRSLFRLFKKDPLDRKYGGFYEYRKSRQKDKRSFWYLVIVGSAYVFVAVVLLIVYNTIA